jgi:hypothetical protein
MVADIVAAAKPAARLVQVSRFTGTNWELFGPIIDGHAE